MHHKTKRAITYTLLAIMLGSIALYASMEDYQKQNFAKFVSQAFS